MSCRYSNFLAGVPETGKLFQGLLCVERVDKGCFKEWHFNLCTGHLTHRHKNGSHNTKLRQLLKNKFLKCISELPNKVKSISKLLKTIQEILQVRKSS